MRDVNLYRVYGLNIKSEIEINEFVKNSDSIINIDIDVKIICGVMPQNIKKLIYEKNENKQISKYDIWFHIKDVATYRVTNGNKVIVEICESANMQMVKIYLMCSCLGFIMLQRDMVAIHGGAVVIDNKAVLFTGDRGAGKSTITNALRNKGYKFITDDVASTYINKVPFVVHGFPYQKLCEDAMDKMGYDKSKNYSFMGDNNMKYLVPSFNNFIEEDNVLHIICELSVSDIKSVKIEEVRGSEKLTKIIKNIYRIEYIDRMSGITPKIFKQCLEIAKYIKFYKITRPREGFTVNEQIELIEGILNSENEEKVV